VDALQYGFRPVVPREAVGDRNPDAHEANLYDVDAKYGDVVSVQEVLDRLRAGGAAQRHKGKG
jgi:maleamate amidohydrolase